MSITPWPASRDYNGNTWAPKGLGSPIPLALISGAHTAHLFGPLHLCADFPNGNPIALASPSSWGLTWNLSFTFTPPPHTTHWGIPYRGVQSFFPKLDPQILSETVVQAFMTLLLLPFLWPPKQHVDDVSKSDCQMQPGPNSPPSQKLLGVWA